MQHVQQRRLYVVGVALAGIAIVGIAVGSYTFWRWQHPYSNPWDTAAIKVWGGQVTSEFKDGRWMLAYLYSLENNTARDYEFPDSRDIVFARADHGDFRTGTPNLMTSASLAGQKLGLRLDTSLFIPANWRVVATVHTDLAVPSDLGRPCKPLSKNAELGEVMADAFSECRIKSTLASWAQFETGGEGFVLFDKLHHYQINFPRPQY